METIFVSLISLALIIISSVTMTFNIVQSSNKAAETWKEMTELSNTINRTDIQASHPSTYSGGQIELTVENTGQTSLNDYSKWDVIAQYQSGEARYLTYSPNYPPDKNQWALEGIYGADENDEIFNPNVLDPGEQVKLSILLNPEISPEEWCRITVATPLGVKSQTDITREPN